MDNNDNLKAFSFTCSEVFCQALGSLICDLNQETKQSKVNNSARTLSEGRTRRVIYDAFQVWSKVSKLTFQETRDNNADIVLKFASGYHGDNYPFDGPNVVLAHAFFPARGMGGDVHFDDDEPWNDRMAKDNTVFLLSTAAHEIGHSLGLGHSKVQNSLMYPYYKYDMKEVKLEYDDIMGIQALYGAGAGGIPRKPVEPTTIRTFEEDDDWTTTSPIMTSPHSTTKAPEPAPQPCDGQLDAVARIRNEIFVFKRQYYWRFNENGELTSRPSEIHRFFYGLPKNLTNVDAVYEWADKDRITIFIGRQFYEFHGTRLLQEPKSLTNIGLPDKVPHVDAAFVWEYNERTYLFAGKKYWRFDRDNRLVEPEYPRSIETVWERLPAYIDAAFTDKAGTTFFFKDDLVYKFNNFFMRVEKNYPKPINEFWPYCAKVKSQNLVAVAANYRQHQETELHSDTNVHMNGHSGRNSPTVTNYSTLIAVILLFHVICSFTLCCELTYQES
uniref:Peptidase metallopeptidase domain-containing protein n=1 Tax=Romanomermis culicivorax TaxID=13658 RepID=A0A915HZK8_ROMCU